MNILVQHGLLNELLPELGPIGRDLRTLPPDARQTPLGAAIRSQLPNVVRRMVYMGADVYAPVDESTNLTASDLVHELCDRKERLPAFLNQMMQFLPACKPKNIVRQRHDLFLLRFVPEALHMGDSEYVMRALGCDLNRPFEELRAVGSRLCEIPNAKSALAAAADLNDVLLLQELLAGGADPNSPATDSGESLASYMLGRLRVSYLFKQHVEMLCKCLIPLKLSCCALYERALEVEASDVIEALLEHKYVVPPHTLEYYVERGCNMHLIEKMGPLPVNLAIYEKVQRNLQSKYGRVFNYFMIIKNLKMKEAVDLLQTWREMAHVLLFQPWLLQVHKLLQYKVQDSAALIVDLVAESYKIDTHVNMLEFRDTVYKFRQ